VDIVATCSYCTQSVALSQINYISPIPAPGGNTLCESTGNVLGGDLTLIPVPGGKTWVLFDETDDTEWFIPDWLLNYNFTTGIASMGSKCLEITLNRTGWGIFRINPQKSFQASDYTHISFMIRAVSGRGIVRVGFGANNSTTDLDNRFFGGSIDNPDFKTGYPIDDTAWQRITVPLSSLGLGNTGMLQNELYGFRFWPALWDNFPTRFYLDEITLGNYQTTRNAQAMDTNNINYQYVYTPSPNTTDPAPSTSNLGDNTANSNGSAWAVPVTVILCLVVATLIAFVVYLKFFASPPYQS
jgi:hypothetical protein